MFINRNIKIIRKLSGLTQAQFAQSVGIKLATLKNYENTEVCPKLPAALAICQFSGIDLGELRSTEINPSAIKFRPESEGTAIANGFGQEIQSSGVPGESEVNKTAEERADLLKFLQSNDEFFKNQYATFNVQVLANLSLLVNQTKKLETLAKMNLAHAQNIERQNINRPARIISRRRQKT